MRIRRTQWPVFACVLALAACNGTPPPEAEQPPLSAAGPDTGTRVGVIEDSIRTEYQPIRLLRVAAGLQNPWSIAFLPDGRMLVTERAGRLNIVDGDGAIARVSGVPQVAAMGQGGLQEVALHPEFASNGWVYLTYSKGDAQATATTLARGRLEGDALVEVQDLFTQDRRSQPGRHYGSRLAWLPDGTLLMSIGDRGAEPFRAQDLGDHAGTLLRLNDDGSAPDDNPFIDREGAQPEIYSYGHRNIQGLIVHPETSEIWATEHGPRGGDELNLIKPGANFGWPVVTRGRSYRDEGPYHPDAVRTGEGMVDPVVDWTPSLAASGLAYVPGAVFKPWAGNLLAGGLRAQQLRRLVFDGDEVVHEEELLRARIGRIRDVRLGPDGFIYLATDEPDGGIYRIEPAD
jgi:aldose sugar dehydrogenase